ncbi:MAG: Tm-1-like ATP-binding domain-containing protein [Desulfomonilaceae bacterium]|nr:Tm-1-like ATP-binding domain-containing protein [Desulfomonilaceae bacterium]
MERAILLISTLDTKGPETLFLRDRIRARGGIPLVLDLSMSAECEGSDITPTEVAHAAGTNIDEIRASRERKKITRLMIEGAQKLARELLDAGRLAAVIGLGGSTGSLMATDVMRALPFGVPKLMVSSTAALPGLSTRYIGTGDIAVFHTVIEITGLSLPLCNVLDRAAAAVAGMAEVPPLTVESARKDGRPLVAMSMFGPTERCAHHVHTALDRLGYQTIGFSAAGVCDRAMEDMIALRFFDGVVDLAPGGVGEEVLGGMRAAGPNRLTSAGKLGIPQVVAPGGVNTTNPRKSRYTPEHHERRKYELDELRTFLRVSDEEMRRIAEVYAEKLGQALGPVIFLFPTKGWSAMDPPTGHMFDPDQDRIFLDILRARVGSKIVIREVDANLDDEVFAAEVEKACVEIFPTP